MGLTNVKKLLLLLLVIWIATLSYIWLPGIVPDFLHLRSNKTANSIQDLKLKGALGKILFFSNASNEKAGKQVHQKAGKQVHQKAGKQVHQKAGKQVHQKAGKQVHVVITSDSSRLGGMVTLINSIVSNTKSPVFFHLIIDEATREHLKQWLTQTKLNGITYEIKVFPEEWVQGKIKVRGTRKELGNPLNYARFYLPRLFPHIHERIVYIDDDCLVQGDIAELSNMKFKPGTLISFSEDCNGASKRITFMQNVYADFFDLKNKHFQELKIKPKACAFNNGVFVTDLSLWNKNNITQQLEHWMELNTREELYGNERGGGGSQPPMMLVFYKKYTPMDLLWHVKFLGWTARTSYNRQYIQSAKLLHWNGRFKPWGRTSSFRDAWDLYYIPDPTKQFHPVRKGIV